MWVKLIVGVVIIVITVSSCKLGYFSNITVETSYEETIVENNLETAVEQTDFTETNNVEVTEELPVVNEVKEETDIVVNKILSEKEGCVVTETILNVRGKREYIRLFKDGRPWKMTTRIVGKRIAVFS